MKRGIMWTILLVLSTIIVNGATITLNETIFHREYTQSGRPTSREFIETWNLNPIPTNVTIENVTMCYKELTTFSGFPSVVCDNDLNISVINLSSSIEPFDINCDEHCRNVNLSESLVNVSKLWNRSNNQDTWYCVNATEHVVIPYNLGWNNVSLWIRDPDSYISLANSYTDTESERFGGTSACLFASGNFTNQTERPYIIVDYINNDPCIYPGGDWEPPNCNLTNYFLNLTGDLYISENVNLSLFNSTLLFNDYQIFMKNSSELNLFNNTNLSNDLSKVLIVSFNNSVINKIKSLDSYFNNVKISMTGTTSSTMDYTTYYHNSNSSYYEILVNNSEYFRLSNTTWIPLINHSENLIRLINVSNAYINNNNFVTVNGLYADEILSLKGGTNITLYNNTFYFLNRLLFAFDYVNLVFFNNTIVNVNNSGTHPMFQLNGVTSFTLNHTTLNSTHSANLLLDVGPAISNIYIENSFLSNPNNNGAKLIDGEASNNRLRNNIFQWNNLFWFQGTNILSNNFYNVDVNYSFSYIVFFGTNVTIINDTFNYTGSVDNSLNTCNATFCHLNISGDTIVNVYDSYTSYVQIEDPAKNPTVKYYKSSRFFLNSSVPDAYNITVYDNSLNLDLTENVGISGLTSYNYYLTWENVNQSFMFFNNHTVYANHQNDSSLNSNRSINFTLNNGTYTVHTPSPANCDYTPPGDWNVIIQCKLNNVSRTVVGNTTVWTTGTLHLTNSTHFYTNKSTFIQNPKWVFLNITPDSEIQWTGGIM